MTDDNNNGETFLEFLKELNLNIEKANLGKYVLILDNCSIHKTPEVLNFFINNKINVMFTPPYMSTFTPIELAFRAIKRITYSRIYKIIEEMVKDIEEFLGLEKTKNTLLYNFGETLTEYINYLNINKDINFNSIEV